VDKEASQFPKFIIDYVSGADPTLELTDSQGKKEKMNVDSWKTEHLREFLKEKLTMN